MKKIKLFLTAFAVLAAIGSALAVKANFFGSGSVYCANTCTTASRVSFRINCNGTMTHPCGTTSGVENPSWTINGACVCTQNNFGLHYDAVAVGE